MSDELTPDAEPLETDQSEPDETPEPEIDIEAEKSRIAEERAAIAKREKELQRGFQEIAARERAAQTPKPVEADPFADLDPQQAAWLKSTIEKTASAAISPELQSMQQFLVSTINDQIDAYAKEQGVDPGDVRDIINTYGLAPSDNSIASVRDVASKAVKLLQVDTFDPKAEERRITEKVLADLADKGVKVEAVRPARAEIGDAEPDWESNDYTMAERYEWMQSHGK